MSKPTVICEIGCNHMGNFDLALKMIDIAINFCDADIIKFQKRDNKQLLTKDDYDAPHPNSENSYGNTYGEHREFLEFNLDQHKILKSVCEKKGKVYASSIWDINSAKEIISLNPRLIKIPSALNLNFKIINFLFDNYKGQIHLSIGMTTEEEVNEILTLFKKSKKLDQLVIYYCKSTYPTEEKDLNLNYIKKMISDYGNEVAGIGFSGHHTGISVDVAALTLGATFFERHFTLNRAYKGTDHAASLEPDGLRRLVRNLREASDSLKDWNGLLSDGEKAQRKKLKKVDKSEFI